MSGNSWEIPVHRDANRNDIQIGVVVLEGRDIVGFVSHYDFRDSNFDGHVSIGERLSSSIGFSRGIFVSTAIKEVQNFVVSSNDPGWRPINAEQINQIRYSNMTSAAADVGTEVLQDTAVSLFVSIFGGPILNGIVAQFTSSVVPQVIFTAVGKKLVEEAINASLSTTPADVGTANYSVRYVPPRTTSDDDEEIEDFVVPSEPEDGSDPEGEIIISSRGVGSIAGSAGNDIIISPHGGDTIDTSAGGDNDIRVVMPAVSGRGEGSRTNVTGGSGDDRLTLVAEDRSTSTPYFVARLPGESVLTASSSFEAIEAFATVEGPREVLLYFTSNISGPRYSTVEVRDGIDHLGYVGSARNDLMIAWGENVSVLGNGGGNTLYADWRGQDVDVTWDLRDTLETEQTLANGWTVQGIHRLLLRLGDGDNEIITDQSNNTIFGGSGNDRIEIHGGGMVDMSAGGDNDIRVVMPVVFGRGEGSRMVVTGGAGDDRLTVIAEHTNTNTPKLEARLSGGSIIDARSSFEDIEAFASAEGPREILLRHSSSSGSRWSTVEVRDGIDHLGYVGSVRDDLMIGLGGDEVFRGGLGNDVAYGNGGRNTYVGTSEELNGDTILDFSANDVIVVEEIEFGLEQLDFDSDSSELRIDSNGDGDQDVRITLRGTFDQDDFNVVHSDGVTEVRYGSALTDEHEPEDPSTEEPVEDEPEGDYEFVLSGTITDRAGEALSDVAVTLALGAVGSVETQTNEDGAFTFTPDADAAGRIDAVRDYSTGDPSITASDALDILRLAVGLDASWGPASAHDFIAADINRDGAVTAADALEVLRAAVGLQSSNQPRWVFLDSETDLEGIDRTNTAIEHGIVFDPLVAGSTHVSITGVLLGSMQEYA